MRSIPQALLWEATAIGGWKWLSLFLLGNALPLAIFGSLSPFGVPPNDQAYLIIFVTIIPILVLHFIVNITTTMGRINRLYTAPISNESLIIWHWAFGGVMLTLQMMIAIAIMNLLFHFNWPFLIPLFLAIGCWSLAQPLVRKTNPSVMGIAIEAIPLIAFLAWYYFKLGGFNRLRSTIWAEITIIDGLVLAASIFVSYLMTLRTVQFDRCGDQSRIDIVGESIRRALLDWISSSKHDAKRFRSPTEAQRWYEWSQKGIVLPLIVSFLLVAGAFIWIPFKINGGSETPEATLLIGVLSMFFYVVIFSAVAGLVMGLPTTQSKQVDPNMSSEMKGNPFKIGSFQSTLPMKDNQIAFAVLHTAMKSSLIAWSIWAVATLICLAIAWNAN